MTSAFQFRLLMLATFCWLGIQAGVITVHSDIPNNLEQQEGRIVGGQQTDIANHPYQVSIGLDSAVLIHICGGSIYAPRVVITAAHCLKGRYAYTLRVVTGLTTLADSAEQGVAVQKLIYHSGYVKKTHANDVGLVILKEALTYSANVQPIVLARTATVVGAHAVATGWGKSDENAQKMSEVLQAVELQIVDSLECGVQYATKQYVITEEMLCAAAEEGGKDTCQGDSGGPLVVDGALVGIVSWGIGCAQHYPGVYASVPYHFEWIEQQAAVYM
ncbi:trypsin delta [Rhagoletis pomonella]|uniref:trypsin delta n=1 Tax=Rhagoletis pomonella TaxID=28610 RepID=UPI001784DC0F|nr:trypsin delta [Rhagoletis pomonella]